MIKGAHKEMIVVRTGNSRYFDEAYFVLREDLQKEKKKSLDILREANRILAETTPEIPAPFKKKNREWFFFIGGGICGSIFSIILTLLLV